MTAQLFAARAAIALTCLLGIAGRASALPTMVRLGYSECASCHVSPQGGGPLTPYGRGIDQAQSLRGGEYTPATNAFVRALMFGGRVDQDVRFVSQQQAFFQPSQSVRTRVWPRLMYRNVTTVGKGFRLSAIVTGESNSTPRAAVAYDPPAAPSSLFVNSALLQYRPVPSFEIAAGRDALPSGINVPDLTLWIKSAERQGYYDAPAQLKAFWTMSRLHVTPFVFTPSGNEAAGEDESGYGTLVEVVLGKRVVLGTTLLNADADAGDRQTGGGYLRLGLNRWGILAQHDRTVRTRAGLTTSFMQSTSYAQLFWAAREWLVLSAIGERLHVGQPFAKKAVAGKLELSARLAAQATVAVSSRLQRDQLTGQLGASVSLQAAFKTVR